MTGKVNAIVSGQSGVAILARAEGLASLHAGRCTEAVRCSPSEARLLLGDALDLQALENVELEEVSRRLDFATAQMDALHVALLLLDGSLSTDTRQTAAKELQELMEDEAVTVFVESALFAHPLPADADLLGAFAACSQETERTRSFLQRLASLQDQITAVHLAWKRIPTAVFGTEEARGSLLSVAVREGLFRDLVFLRKNNQVSIGKLLAGSLLRSKIRREILLVWGLTLEDLSRPESTPIESYQSRQLKYLRQIMEKKETPSDPLALDASPSEATYEEKRRESLVRAMIAKGMPKEPQE